MQSKSLTGEASGAPARPTSSSGASAGGSATAGPATDTIETDICVIGAGSGGLSVAAAAAAFGQRVVLIEKHKMGGDCLNYGCVPSKALIAAGKRAHAMRTSAVFGIAPVSPAIDPRGVHDHVKGVIAAIAPNDSVERFTGLGVRVIKAAARFADRRTVMAGESRITARRFVIATGSSPVVPPIPGLDQIPYFTNETMFDNQERIAHLLIIGGGPIGLELAQAHLRLGARVTVLEGAKALGKDDPEMTAQLLDMLRAEGIDLREGTKVERVEGGPGKVRLRLATPQGQEFVEGTHLLIAAGRQPNVRDLNLEGAGVRYEKSGIVVDKGLRTTNKKIFAIGDVTGGLQFTHVANEHAGIVIRRALFRLPAKVNSGKVPWVTYTEPELAHVGLTEEAARAQGHKVSALRWPFHENDRAQAERTTEGSIKVVTDRKGRILGATILGDLAGELIPLWALAISQGLKIKAMTEWIAPYPTRSEVSKRAAIRYFATVPSKPIVRRIIGLLAKLG